MDDRACIRLSTLSKHIKPESQPAMEKQPEEPEQPEQPRKLRTGGHSLDDPNWITCHVLDTTTGRPAAGITATLKLMSPTKVRKGEPSIWRGTTDKDGRIKQWGHDFDRPLHELFDLFVHYVKHGGAVVEGQMIWSLTFDTGMYFGKGNTFYPEVEVRFATKVDEEHYHVPLLLGPWSYTTYRGS